ncbi:MAG: PBECR2 nuclease fold domain-containing protein [Oscillospiraceae bacterium]|nr:PBECR2 nuclease fold domain-containing protein [Oscillospiraceae bacterium]
MTRKVGEISQRVIDLLNLNVKSKTPIFTGKSNVLHMQKSHKQDYKAYGRYIPAIIENPDYVGINPSDDSIEFVKIFEIDGKFVKVAVRISDGGNYYARTIYARELGKFEKFVESGHLIKY